MTSLSARNEKPVVIIDADGRPAGDYWLAAGLRHPDMEAALLGIIMADSEMPERLQMALMERVSLRLGTDPAIFEIEIHQRVYTAMLAIAGRGLLPSKIAVDAEMRRMNVQGYIIGDLNELILRALADGSLQAGQIEGMCQDILDAAARRQMLSVLSQASQHVAQGTPVEEVKERTAAAFERVRQPHVGADTTMETVASSYRQQMQEWRAKPHALRGITSGLRNLDVVTKGFRKGDLIVVGGRTSMGKTLFGVEFANAAANDIMTRTEGYDHQVGIISLEMSCEQLMHRLVSARTGIDAEMIEQGDTSLDWERIDDAVAELEIMPMVWVDNRGANNRVNGQRGQMTVEHIRQLALAWHRKSPLDILLIDFLERITASPETRKLPREERLAHAVDGLKNLAAELHIPVILLAQLNRENEKAGKFVPQLEHFRGSDTIGHLADVVIFPVRWDYYRERGTVVPEDRRKMPMGYTDLFIQKNRMGRVGAVSVYTDMDTYRIYDWSDKHKAPVNAQGQMLWNWKARYWPEQVEGKRERSEDGD